MCLPICLMCFPMVFLLLFSKCLCPKRNSTRSRSSCVFRERRCRWCCIECCADHRHKIVCSRHCRNFRFCLHRFLICSVLECRLCICRRIFAGRCRVFFRFHSAVAKHTYRREVCESHFSELFVCQLVYSRFFNFYLHPFSR